MHEAKYIGPVWPSRSFHSASRYAPGEWAQPVCALTRDLQHVSRSDPK